MKKSFLMPSIFIFSIFIGCEISNNGNTNKANTQNINETFISIENNKSDFETFCSYFKSVELPFTLITKDKNWINFTSDVTKLKINEQDVIKFFFNNDSVAFFNNNSWCYYGFRIEITENLIGLIYYKVPDDDGYTGYVLSIFNRAGGKLNDFLFSGSEGDFDITNQIETEMDKNMTLHRTTITIISESKDSFFLGEEKVEKFRIKENGNLISDTNAKIDTSYFHFNKDYRVVK